MTPLEPLTEAEKARLRDEGQAALRILASGLGPAILAAIVSGGQPQAWLPLLLGVLRQVGQVFATDANAQLAIRELKAVGALSRVEAGVLSALIALHENEPPPDLIEHPPSPPMDAPAPPTPDPTAA